jgi:hypothetical protein
MPRLTMVLPRPGERGDVQFVFLERRTHYQ